MTIDIPSPIDSIDDRHGDRFRLSYTKSFS